MTHKECIYACRDLDLPMFTHAVGCPNASEGPDCEHGRFKSLCTECAKDKEIKKLNRKIDQLNETILKLSKIILSKSS